MSKPTFYFITFFLLSLPFASNGFAVSLQTQSVICAVFIFTIGIAHGSIDNILYLSKTQSKPFKFYIAYLVLISLFGISWFIFPVQTLIAFLLISAYHFGQSQLVDCLSRETIVEKLAFLTWGIGIISALIHLNQNEITGFLASQNDLKVFAHVLSNTDIKSIHWFATSFTLLFLLYQVFTNSLNWSRFWFETFILLVINFSFFVLPALVGFTLYFIFLHSFKVLEDEFNFLKKVSKIELIGFIKKLLPNTIISILATVILLTAVNFEVIDFSYGFVVLVLISSITAPHAFVMEKFYK